MADESNREKEIFEKAFEMESAEERFSFLNAACGDDRELLARIQLLLQASAGEEDFLPEAPQERLSPRPLAEKPGDRIGRYKLLQRIGEGGCGVVYMAEQEEPVRRRVALKIIKLGMDTKQVIARFEAERQALAMMDHPNIAKVLDAGATETGRPYFVMELVRGIKITEFCDENRLSTDDRLKLFIQVCKAIQHAHQKGIIHRDVKPSNILVTVNDAAPVPKVIDFGIAKATQGRLTDQTLFTAFEQFIGTPAYMSPEQAVMTSLDVDTRSDIYSLGVLLYELLTARTPFDTQELLAVGLDEMRRTILEKDPPRPSTRFSTMAADAQTTTARHRHTEVPKLIHLLRGDLDWIVMRCLEKERNRRYETANGLAMDVQRHLEHDPVVARPPTVRYRFQKLVRRNRVAVVVFAGFVLLLSATAVVSTALAVWAKEKKRQAEESEADAKAVLEFFQEHVLAAARPEGQRGGLGRDVTIRAAVDAAEPLIADTFTNRPLVEAAIREALGGTYYYLGEAERAGQQHRRAMELRRLHLGLEHPDSVATMDSLGEDLRIAGRPAEAIPYLEQALELGEKTWGPTHSNTFSLMNDLALNYVEAGRMMDGIALLEKTLNLRRKHLGPNDPDTIVSLHNLGNSYREAGRYQEALPRLEQAIELARTNLSPDHPDLLTMMNNLAVTYSAVGNSARSAEIHQEVLERRKDVLGPNNPYTIGSMTSLAMAWNDLGRSADALELLEEAARRARDNLSESHPYTMTVLNNLALTYLDWNRLDDALPLLERTLKLRKETLPSNHPLTLASMHNLAWGYQKAGNLTAAVPLYEETLELLMEHYPDSPDTLTTMNNLALAYQEADRMDDAMPLLKRTLELRKEKLPPNHPLTLASMHNLAWAYQKTGDLDAALSLFEETLELQKVHRGPDHPDTLTTMNNLALAYQEADRLEDALQVLPPVYEALERRQAESASPARVQTLAEIGGRIAQLHDALGHTKLAEEWRQRIKALGEGEKE